MSLIFQADQKIKVTGDFSFAFSLDCQKEESAISALIAVASNQDLRIPIQCQWKRVINNREYIIPVSSNVYQPSCEDISCRIIVEVVPIDSHDGQGKATAKTPKLLLDVMVRSNLESILHQGIAKFPVSFTQPNLADKVLDARLEISRDTLKIEVFLPDGRQSSELSYKGTYSIDFPSIILHRTDCKRLIMMLDDSIGATTMQCLSRTSRDLIVMSMRVFAAHNYLLHSKALELISSDQPKFNQIELTLELQEVILQLSYLLKKNSELSNERLRHKKELSNMEKEMASTIEAYQGLLNCNNADKNSDLTEEIFKVKEELDKEIKSRQKNRKRMKRKDAEIQELKKRIEEMQESQQNLVWELKEAKEKADLKRVDEKAEQKVLEMQKEIEDVKRELYGANARINELGGSIRAGKEKFKVLEVENEKLKGEIFEHSSLLQELAQMKNQNEALLGQRAIMSKRIEVMQGEVNDLQRRIETEQATNKENLMKIEEENKTLKVELEKALEESKQGPSVDSYKEEAQKYRQQCDSLAAQLSRVQAQVRKNK